MARKKATCPECGGTKMGRGFAHKAGCSLARPSGGNRRGKRGRRRMARSAATGGSHAGKGFGFDLRKLKGMEIEQLASLKDKIDAMMKSKAPSLKAKIKSLVATLARIR